MVQDQHAACSVKRYFDYSVYNEVALETRRVFYIMLLKHLKDFNPTTC